MCINQILLHLTVFWGLVLRWAMLPLAPLTLVVHALP